MTTSTSTRKPPASAVAKDAHWAKTMARLDKRKPATATLTICDEPEAKQGLADAKAEHRAAQAAQEAANADEDTEAYEFTTRRVDRAKAAVDTAQSAFDKVAIRLTFQAIPRKELEALEAEHPPTEQEESDGASWHMDTFAPALISAASTDGMPADYARHCLDSWSAADAQALWTAAWGIQRTSRTDLGKG